MTLLRERLNEDEFVISRKTSPSRTIVLVVTRGAMGMGGGWGGEGASLATPKGFPGSMGKQRRVDKGGV